MSDINELSSTTPTGSQLIPVWDTANGATRNFSVSALTSYVQSQATSASGTMESQVYAPNAAWTVTVTPTTNGNSVWLRVTPTTSVATATITLPLLAQCIDMQEVLVTCTQAVTTLTVSGNGSTVNGAPTTLAANAFFSLKFDAVTDSWYRIG